MNRWIKGALLLCLLLCLSGCSALKDALRSDASLPDLNLLDPIPYAEELPDAAPAAAQGGALRLDLWLDASQVMGGINPNEESIYTHKGMRFREGGFHYRYGSDVGMYEGLLRCMLSAAEGSRVRVLRAGNERLPDSFLISSGLALQDAPADVLRSIRRDMLTCAIDPMPTFFSTLSAEDMSGSFYALGTPMLNQLDAVNADLLENPALAQAMSRALDRQIATFKSGRAPMFDASGADDDAPLLYALDNLDLDRLSVITCDPAAIRRLSTVDAQGTPVDLLSRILDSRGVFDRGLTVGVYAFTLDYMGQMGSFGAADLSEPLIWGRLRYNASRNRSEAALPMPRTLLTLVVGSPQQVAAYTAALDEAIARSEALGGLRGSTRGELAYTQNGQTIKQQPFGFSSRYWQLDRPAVAISTQRTPGVQLTAQGGDVSTAGSLATVAITRDQTASFTLSVPLQAMPQGVNADLTQLADLKLSVTDSRVLTRTLPNLPDTVPPEDAQVIALRDTLYVFEKADSAQQSFACTGVSEGVNGLSIQISADSAQLLPGYYRVTLTADLSGGVLSWQTPAWISECSATLTNEQIAHWEQFTRMIATYERKRGLVSRPFQHAWGTAENTVYHGVEWPDCPPVMKAPHLSELANQLMQSANLEQTPCIRYVFDVYVKE